MQTFVFNVFLVLIILLMILIFVILYLKLLENERIKKYGEHYNEDHFREQSSNKDALVTENIRKKYQIKENYYRYKGKEYNTKNTLFFEGTRDDDRALYIDNKTGNRKNLKILSKRLYKSVPTESDVNKYSKYFSNIEHIGIIHLKEGYFVFYLINQ